MPCVFLHIDRQGRARQPRPTFIRTKHDPKSNRTRVQIVESMRTGDKVRQKILRHIGTVHTDQEIADIKHLAERADGAIARRALAADGAVDAQGIRRSANAGAPDSPT